MKRANISIYLVFIFLAFIIITVGALVGPMGTLFGTELYSAGETILDQANDSIANIQDSTIRNQIYGIVNTAQNSAVDNIDFSASLYTYSWIILLVITLIVLFLFTRRVVEVGGGGLV